MKKYSKLFLPLIYSLIFITAIWSYQNIETVNSNTNIFIHEVQIHTQNIINQVTGKKKQKPKLTKDNSQRTEKRPLTRSLSVNGRQILPLFLLISKIRSYEVLLNQRSKHGMILAPLLFTWLRSKKMQIFFSQRLMMIRMERLV